ncbi:MAG: hypothetical protein JSR76_00875 [Verrucomicrobia bacterium]|nr:hypothetical protein [Verrucomicrobiota bacterium]
MHRSSRYLLFTSLLALNLYASEIEIDLKNPTYRNGVLSTEEGGIIQTDEMRIQAHTIAYTKRKDEHFLTARGNLLITLQGKFFIGDSFTYNFLTKEGELTRAVTRMENIFVDGERVLFHKDGTLSVSSAFVTTSEASPPLWKIAAESATIDGYSAIKANNLKLSLYNTPIFALPSYTTTLRKEEIEEPASLYRVFWEKKQGPLFLFRYRLFENENSSLFWRLEYRLRRIDKTIKQGAGTAFEYNYITQNKAHSLETRNFYAYDTFYNDLNPERFKHRYRIQGVYTGHSENKKIETFARWDLLSDRYMRSDFPTQLFELTTLERTEAFIKARYDAAFASLYARPRLNDFTGFQQELPTFKIAFKPYSFGNTGLILENSLKLSNLDYVYAKELESAVKNFHASRFEINQALHRSFSVGPLFITPEIGSNLIYYGNTPNDTTHFQAVGKYALETNLPLWKSYETGTHLVKPYANYLGLITSTNSLQDHFIFSSNDGFHNVNDLKFGLLNNFTATSPLLPTTTLDLSLHHFFNSPHLKSLFPKGESKLTFEYPRCLFTTTLGWNGEVKKLDYANFQFGLTYNEYFAFSFELSHRGPYAWRKNNQTNYILDLTHPIEELYHSPLSDPRTTLLAKWELKIAPFWTLDIANQIGKRPNEPLYHESKVDLYTVISNTWRLRLSYTRAVNTNAFSFGINLL